MVKLSEVSSKKVHREAHSSPTDDLSGGGGPPRCLLDGLRRSGEDSILFCSKTAAKNHEKSVRDSNHPNAALTLLCRGIDRNQLAQLSCYGLYYSLATGGTRMDRLTALFHGRKSKKASKALFLVKTVPQVVCERVDRGIPTLNFGIHACMLPSPRRFALPSSHALCMLRKSPEKS
jgi:hypothetical protein